MQRNTCWGFAEPDAAWQKRGSKPKSTMALAAAAASTSEEEASAPAAPVEKPVSPESFSSTVIPWCTDVRFICVVVARPLSPQHGQKRLSLARKAARTPLF